MALIDEVRQIIDGYEFEESAYGGLFDFEKGKMINLKEDVTNELFSNIFTKICELYGKPIYVDSYYGYIWKEHGEVLAYKLYEKNYNYDVVAFFIFKKLPMGKKLTYSEYAQIDEVVKQILTEHNLNYYNFIHYFDRKFMYLGENTDERTLIVLKRHSLKFIYSKKVPYNDRMKRVIPCYSRKIRISLTDVAKLRQVLQNCFIVE